MRNLMPVVFILDMDTLVIDDVNKQDHIFFFIFTSYLKKKLKLLVN